MPNTATVTGVLGPAQTVTSLVLTNVTRIDFDLTAQTVTIWCDQGNPCFSLYGTTTVTYTIATRVATVTISQ